MENYENQPNQKQDQERPDLCPGTINFETSRGSIYKKQPDGTFKRHKYDGTTYEPMEWTVFTDSEGEKEIQWAKTKLGMTKMTGKIIFFTIGECDEDGRYVNEAYHPYEIVDPTRDPKNGFDLISYETDSKGELEIIMQTPITFVPKIGYTVFEFSNNGLEYHHGDHVSRITTQDK